jgi:hypothetical protein
MVLSCPNRVLGDSSSLMMADVFREDLQMIEDILMVQESVARVILALLEIERRMIFYMSVFNVGGLWDCHLDILALVVSSITSEPIRQQNSRRQLRRG